MPFYVIRGRRPESIARGAFSLPQRPGRYVRRPPGPVPTPEPDMQTLGPFTILFSDLPNDADTHLVATVPAGFSILWVMQNLTQSWDPGGAGPEQLEFRYDLGGPSETPAPTLSCGLTNPLASISPLSQLWNSVADGYAYTRAPTTLTARYKANGGQNPATQGSATITLLLQPVSNP